jgi:putative ABC transport system permease protein
MFAERILQEVRQSVGMDVQRLAILRTGLSVQSYEPARALRAVAGVISELSDRSDVDAAAASTSLPTEIDAPGVYIASGDGTGPSDVRRVGVVAATPGILRTLGIRLVRGRAFDDRERGQASIPVIMSERAATTIFGSSDAVGRSIRVFESGSGGDSTRATNAAVIGVAADAGAHSHDSLKHGIIYRLLSQHYSPDIMLLVRAKGDPSPLVDIIRTTLERVDPGISVVASGTGSGLLGQRSLVLRLSAVMTSALGVLALLLALAGLYGLLSHIFQCRTREIGVRIALGANKYRIARLVIRDGIQPVLYGVGGGLCLGLAGNTIVGLLFPRPIPQFDIRLFGLVAVSVLIAAVVACWVPARRASRVDPYVVLRDL